MLLPRPDLPILIKRNDMWPFGIQIFIPDTRMTYSMFYSRTPINSMGLVCARKNDRTGTVYIKGVMEKDLQFLGRSILSKVFEC